MKLADVSVRRPVFAVMMSAALIVLGWFSYRELGLDLMPKTDYPTVTVGASLPGASAEEIETTDHQADRGGGQHDQRHRRAALQLEPGQRALLDHVRARARDRGGDAGRARQGGDASRFPRDTDPPSVTQDRPGLVADPHDRRVRGAVAEGADADRRQADQAGARDGAGRRRGQPDGRSPARDPRPARPDAPERLRADDGAGGERGRRGRTWRSPGGSFIAGPSEISMRTMGRLRDVEDFEQDRAVLQGRLGHHASATSARVTDSNEEVRSQTRLWKPRWARTRRARPPSRCRSASSRARTRSRSWTGCWRGSSAIKADAAARHQASRRSRDQSRFIRKSFDGDPAPPAARRPVRRDRRVLLHPEPARDDHRGPRDPDLDHRHVHGDEGARLHAEQHDDAVAVARDGHRHRRRDRRAGEHLPVHRGEGRLAAGGRDEGDRRDRPGRDGDDAVARGDLPARSPS